MGEGGKVWREANYSEGGKEAEIVLRLLKNGMTENEDKERKK